MHFCCKYASPAALRLCLEVHPDWKVDKEELASFLLELGDADGLPTWVLRELGSAGVLDIHVNVTRP
jgi:hypothetical protein